MSNMTFILIIIAISIFSVSFIAFSFYLDNKKHEQKQKEITIRNEKILEEYKKAKSYEEKVNILNKYLTEEDKQKISEDWNKISQDLERAFAYSLKNLENNEKNS